MAMPMNNQEVNTRTRRSQTTKPVVPAPSRAATARKLEPVSTDYETEIDELDFESELPVPASIKTKPNPQTEADRQARLDKLQRLTEKRDKLVDRLDTGAAEIEKARSKGQDVSSWEDFWIALLRQYEEVCDSIRDIYAHS